MYANSWNIFLNTIGAYVLVFYLYDALKSPVILGYYYLKRLLGFGEPNLLAKYGDWAAITGSTDGIGKAYARELARKGFNIILISRNQSKLEKVAEEIESDFHVKTKIIVADFGEQAICQYVEQELNKTPVRVLINNVSQTKGASYSLDEYTSEDIWQLINTNMGAATQLSRYLINRLKNAKQKGLIVNVSSGTSYTPTPWAALYAAAKTFISEITLALQAEAQPYGIDIQLLTPFFVLTKINSHSPDIMRGGIFIPEPTIYARSACDTLGKVDNTTGYSLHGLQSTFNKCFNWRARLRVLIFLMDIMNFRAIGNPKWIFTAFKLFLHAVCFIYIISMYVGYLKKIY